MGSDKRKVLMERKGISLMRCDFLRKIKEIENWDNVVYLDETWLNANHTVSKTWTDDTEILYQSQGTAFDYLPRWYSQRFCAIIFKYYFLFKIILFKYKNIQQLRNYKMELGEKIIEQNTEEASTDSINEEELIQSTKRKEYLLLKFHRRNAVRKAQNICLYMKQNNHDAVIATITNLGPNAALAMYSCVSTNKEIATKNFMSRFFSLILVMVLRGF
ncbi:unnamed protein product [Colias eurytheme]|nr:unnamed protein product [Colias eurytheme]